MAKSKYAKWLTEEGLKLLQGWARAGLSDEQIAKNMGVSRSTFYEWQKKYKTIATAVRNAKEVADLEVENALYQNCVGHWEEEEKAFKCKEVYYDKQGRRCEREKLQTINVKVYYPGETMAQTIWLNNRQSERWRRNAGKEKLDKERLEHTKDIDNKRFW